MDMVCLFGLTFEYFDFSASPARFEELELISLGSVHSKRLVCLILRKKLKICRCSAVNKDMETGGTVVEMWTSKQRTMTFTFS